MQNLLPVEFAVLPAAVVPAMKFAAPFITKALGGVLGRGKKRRAKRKAKRERSRFLRQQAQLEAQGIEPGEADPDVESGNIRRILERILRSLGSPQARSAAVRRRR